ncbi:MAG TPA: cytochrome c [Cyclobacteriaceae bacterium]|nr:cytochrome c [Cyclobacteriaceae bacterium]
MRTRFTAFAFIVFITISCSKKGSDGSGESVDPLVKESIVRGEAVYKQSCLPCHMADGGGAPPMNPPLTGTSFVKGDKAVLAGIVLKGMSNEPVDGEKYHNVMPAMDMLNDEQIADVLTYVRNSFGNKESAVLSNDVKLVREKDPD